MERDKKNKKAKKFAFSKSKDANSSRNEVSVSNDDRKSLNSVFKELIFSAKVAQVYLFTFMSS
jgi:hypothetical protein